MKAALFVVLALQVNAALAGISSSPGLQRKVMRSNCTLQWTVTGTVTNFVIYNETTGTAAALNSRASQPTFDSTSNTISVTIANIALSDAGNYSLSISNGASWEKDSNALIFVFGYASLSLTQDGRTLAKEGDSVEVTCGFQSGSLPVAYRPRVLYFWYPRKFSYNLQALTNGSLQTPNGEIVSGYSTRNDGRTLIIASVQYNDIQFISCHPQEEGSPTLFSSPTIYLSVQHKPFVTSTTPPTRKFNAVVGERIQLSVSVAANPALQAPGSNWTFVSSRGIALALPDASVAGSYMYPSLIFTLPSVNYYGNYSYNMTNAIGTTTVTFEVLSPGPPDPPAALKVHYVTHFSIALQWNCMWANSNSRSQYVYTQLKEANSDVIVGANNYSLSGTCYNTTIIVYFSTGIKPETSYEAKVWSTNENGSSSPAELSVRSSKVFRFFVLPDWIRINGTRAIINYYLLDSEHITQFSVSWCGEYTGACVTMGLFNVNNTLSQVSFYIGSFPNDKNFVFDFFLYVVNSGLAGALKGVRVSTVPGLTTPSAGNCESQVRLFLEEGEYVGEIAQQMAQRLKERYGM